MECLALWVPPQVALAAHILTADDAERVVERLLMMIHCNLGTDRGLGEGCCSSWRCGHLRNKCIGIVSYYLNSQGTNTRWPNSWKWFYTISNNSITKSSTTSHTTNLQILLYLPVLLLILLLLLLQLSLCLLKHYNRSLIKRHCISQCVKTKVPKESSLSATLKSDNFQSHTTPSNPPPPPVTG